MFLFTDTLFGTVSVFESHDVDGGWDGTYGDQIVQDGTYVWKIKFGLNNKTDDKQAHVGHVSLIRRKS